MAYFLDYPFIAWRALERIEGKFDEKRAISWMNKNWWWSLIFSTIYLVLVVIGWRYMRHRRPFYLRRQLCMWSTALAVFSIYASSKVIPHVIGLIRYGGFEYSVCDMNYFVGSTRMGIWCYLFPLSKLFEFVDTIFIVLRKSKITFLHCYHHISVFIYCWHSYAYPISPGGWFGIVNYFVHGVMYSYFATKASGRNPSRRIALMVTTVQLSQMFVGIYLNYTTARALYFGRVCGVTWLSVGTSIFFYLSYAILFSNFYYWTYIRNKRIRSSKEDEHVGFTIVPLFPARKQRVRKRRRALLGNILNTFLKPYHLVGRIC